MLVLPRVLCLGMAALGPFSALSAAASWVGRAETVVPAAQSEGVRGAVILAKGAEVNAFDRVRTSVDGTVTLRFRDATILEVGPGSVVTIDRFVYNRDNTASQAVLTMSKGTFRWISGTSPKDAYVLKTPSATLGVRGTEFVVVADPVSTSVELKHGAVRACSLSSGRCGDIVRPGQGIRLWSDGRLERMTNSGLVQRHAQRVTRLTQPHRTLGPGPLGPRPLPVKQQWSGSFVPKAGLTASLPTQQQLSALPALGTAAGHLRQGAIQLPHKQPLGPVTGPGMGQHIGPPRVHQPGPVERKGPALPPVTFRPGVVLPN